LAALVASAEWEECQVNNNQQAKKNKSTLQNIMSSSALTKRPLHNKLEKLSEEKP